MFGVMRLDEALQIAEDLCLDVQESKPDGQLRESDIPKLQDLVDQVLLYRNLPLVDLKLDDDGILRGVIARRALA